MSWPSWPPRLTWVHVVSLFSYCEEIPVEENEVNDSSSKSSIETKPDASPQLPKKSITNSTLTSTGSSEAPASVRSRSPALLPPQPGEQAEGRLVIPRSAYAEGLHINECRIQSWVLGV